MKKRLATVLLKIRTEKQYTQSGMASFLGVSLRNYLRLESGGVTPGLDTLSKISGATKIPLGEILNGPKNSRA